MARRQLQAAKCSQMSNPSDGSGSGGDRCTEACCAIIANTYRVPIPGLDVNTRTGEQSMYWFTQMLNKGSNVSALENAAWINRWMSSHGGPTLNNTHAPSYQDIINMVDRGHIGVGGFNYYENLRLSSGANPYKWTDHGLRGHVLIVVGYDTSAQTVIVHDPLRADPSGQPADYTWASFQNAGFADLSEAMGAQLNTSSGILSGIAGMFGTTGGGSGHPATFLAPDAGVVNFLIFMDQMEDVQDPFTVSGVSTPWDWASAVGSNFWGDTQAIGFRFLIILVGVLILIRLVQSWLQVSGVGAGAGQATLAALA
jgi:hypothetical protein